MVLLPWIGRPSPLGNAKANLHVLRWLAIVLPVLFLEVLDILRHTVLSEPLHTLPGFVSTHLVILAAVVVFSYAIFGLVARLQGKIIEQNRQLSALNSIAAAAAEQLGLDDLLTTGLDHVMEAMDVKFGIICLVDLEMEEHSAVCIRGFSPEMARRIQWAKLKDDPVAAEVVRTGRPVIFEQVFKETGVSEAARKEGIRSGISAPLKSEGEVNGILAIASTKERRFSENEQEFLDGIGGHLGLAIRNAVLYEESRLQNNELRALLAVGRAVASSVDLDEAIAGSLDTVIDVTSADAAEIWLVDGDGELTLQVHRGELREAFLERTSFRVGEGLPGIVAETLEPIVVHDLPNDPRFVRQKVTEAGFHTFCALPMLYRGRVVGVLAVAALSKDSMKQPWELPLLEGVGERVAMAIEVAHLHQQVQDLAVLRERERIAREMHDGLGQVLGYINTQTLAVKKLLADKRMADATSELGAMEAAARGLYADVREGILGLRTAPHRDGGLIPALREYVERYGETAGIDARLRVSPETERSRLPPPTEIQLMRIVQEALSNVRKHARATSVSVDFSQINSDLEVEVVDDGQGFDPTLNRSAGWPRFGLQTMRERAESVGGSFAVESTATQGTRVVVRVPLKAQQRVKAQP